jgi:hypothetical protein
MKATIKADKDNENWLIAAIWDIQVNQGHVITDIKAASGNQERMEAKMDTAINTV